ncbi:MAG: hypothetical protein IJQ56_07300, partial [Synergistaceae bacterium]|nr:hypothetical protein [Synergistaceae bacterium]
VELSNNYQTLWRAGSIYNDQLSDPSLVLPMKFIRESGTTFKASTNHETATKLRGIRFYMPDLAVRTNNKLVKGIPYKIKVPVYNASFVDANNVEVRLSYVPAAKFKANIYEVDKNVITVIGTAKVSLKGWRNGSNKNKGWAEFDYTFPVNNKNLKSGNYEFYVEIDPDNAIKEVHESRFEKSTANKIIDVGGNNEGHFPFELWGFDDTNPKTAKVSAASGGLVYSSAFDVQDIIDADKVRASYGTYDTTNTVVVYLTFDGDETTKTMYDKLKAQAAIDPEVFVPIDVEMRYDEDSSVKDAYPEVIFYAYNTEFTAEALTELFEKFDTMTDEEIERYFKERDIDRINNGFLRRNVSLFPGETTKFTIHLRPSAVLLDDDHVPIFEVYIPALAPELNISSSDVEPEGRDWGDFQYMIESDDESEDENISDDVMPLGSNSSGCDVGFSALGLGILSAALIFRRKSR